MITLKDKEFREISEYVKQNYGINLTEKANLIEGRLQNILLQKNMSSFSEFYNYLIGDQTGEALTILLNKITTNHTFFMREADHFDYFAKTILPYLKDTQSRTKDLKIWSAGCSTGDEPYTLAMIIEDFFGSEKALWDSKILATDISKNALDIASEGIYTDEHLSNVPLSWKNNYFKKIDTNRWCVSDKIKNDVIFRSFNLMNDSFPFKSKFHVIFCRNVMIYFDNETKVNLVNKFYEHMEPGGYLFIGHSESLQRNETKFTYIMPSVYRKE